MDADDTDDDDEQWRAFDALYQQVMAVLKPFGTHDAFGNGAYLVVDDNYGWKRHKIEIHRLHMLHPAVVRRLRALLDNFADWEIVISVDIPGTEGKWPLMGLTIRRHEIIDGLHREYLPEGVRKFQYEGSRPGTGYD